LFDERHDLSRAQLVSIPVVPHAYRDVTFCTIELLCIAALGFGTPRASNIHTVFLAAAKSRTLELLAFDEYCRFDTSAFFIHIKRGSLYTHKKSRSIKTAIFIES
jgi:hypothetical protein